VAKGTTKRRSGTSRRATSKLTDATYLDRLGERVGRESGRAAVEVAIRNGLTTEIPTTIAQRCLDRDVEALTRAGLLDWNSTPGIRKDVFIGAWVHGFQWYQP
jgi:hypothetical protein